MPEIPASLERRQQWDPKQAWCRGVGSRRAGSGGNGGNARRCPHRPLPDSPPGWLVRLSAPETACGESPAGSWCSSLPPRPPRRPGSGSEGFPFLLSVGWACERLHPRPRPVSQNLILKNVPERWKGWKEGIVIEARHFQSYLDIWLWNQVNVLHD